MMTARVDPRAERTAADQKSSPVAAGKTRRAPGICLLYPQFAYSLFAEVDLWLFTFRMFVEEGQS